MALTPSSLTSLSYQLAPPLTWLAYADPLGGTFLSGGFLIEVDNITGPLVVATWREPVEVGVDDLAKRDAVTSSDLRAFVSCYTGATMSVNVQIRH